MRRGIPEDLSLAGKARWVLERDGAHRLSTLAKSVGAKNAAMLLVVLREDLTTGRIYTNKGFYRSRSMNDTQRDVLDVLKDFSMTRMQLQQRLKLTIGGVSKRLRRLRERKLIRIVDWERSSHGMAPIYGLSDGAPDTPLPAVQSKAPSTRAHVVKEVAPRSMYDQLGAR